MHPYAHKIYLMQVEPQQKDFNKVKSEPSVRIKSEQPQQSVVVKREQSQQSVVMQSASKPVFTVDIPTMHCHMHCTSSQDADRSAPLEKGPDGLLVARFGETVHTTELCNLMLFAAPPAKKRPAAACAIERPAPEVAESAAASEDAVAEGASASAAPPLAAAPPAPPAEDAPPAKDDYAIMWYKRDKTIAIRAKFGAKQQVLSFGGKACTKDHEEMRGFAKVVVADLHAGMSIADAKNKGKGFAFPAD